jgi:hypothetical protein
VGASDWFGTPVDSARAWGSDPGPVPVWISDRAAPLPFDVVAGPEVDVLGGVDIEAMEEDLRAADFEADGLVAGSVGSDPGLDVPDDGGSSYDPSGDMALYQAEMMMMEAQHNANMMAISGIGGYQDMNYNGHIDYADMGCSNTYGSLNHYP